MKISTYFTRCLSCPYTRVENGGDFYAERAGNVLTVYLQHSDGVQDWKNNLDFPARVYERGGAATFFAHRGFLRVWQSIRQHLEEPLRDGSIGRIVSVGYSHGAALALLCHEYARFLRPDLGERIVGLGFGTPRVLWGWRTPSLCARWEGFLRVCNADDIVTRLPPAALGYFHVGSLLTLAPRGTYSATDAHRPENILAFLRRTETQKKS